MYHKITVQTKCKDAGQEGHVHLGRIDHLPTRDVVSVHVVDEVDKAEEGCRRPLALQRRCLPLPQAHPAYCKLLYYNFKPPLVISEFHYE